MKPQIRLQILTYKRAVCGNDVILHTQKAQQLDFSWTSSCCFMSSDFSDGSPSIYPSFPFLPIHPQCGVLVHLLFQLPLLVGRGRLLLKRQSLPAVAGWVMSVLCSPEQLLSSKHLHSFHFAAFEIWCVLQGHRVPAVAPCRWVCTTTGSHVLPALCSACYFRTVMSCLIHSH